jgi:DNA-binding CsgD family transcriptional regulator
MAEQLKTLQMYDEADILRAAQAFRTLARSHGNFQVAPHANISSAAAMTDAAGLPLASTVFGWEDDDNTWWRNPRLALDSPLPRACRYESQPFWLNRHGIYGRNPNSHLSGFDMSFIARTLGDLAAIVVPVHLPFSQIGVVSFTCLDRRRTTLADEYDRFWPQLQLFATVFIADYVRVRPEPRALPHDCTLTKREVDCLRWAALGKTDAEIALIIGRAKPTVRFHIDNAAAKLRANNRAQAIFKAGQLGFLGIVA